ncbi:2Fe-2S iron-sulfur cluster-binding protein [Microvirga mediterraneensis]|uniref:2Fe-2S iron-sulfur cluster binding domain-containing protein n=1 Tax=Microvirga mediterraneensis TaxID=2754695 RepID=A0A838BTU2_9HYPH|nr:2Fe-2S iron-sulfur cluster-binding protein [Microvirga mediterraneensis]MBA1158778.1 2Fe-2S iron-sulfur cluster binding domain-containing protein [Microvirga mediterraneensis]
MGHSIHIRSANRTVSPSDGQTILASALDAGIAYPHGCRSGRCGACKSRLVEGEVELLPHTPFALTEQERQQGLILACRAVPVTSGEVLWLQDDADSVVHPVVDLKARIIDIVDATHDIKRIRMTAEDGTFSFSAGQYARLTFPGAPARDYSMASHPKVEEIEFHIRRVPEGRASSHIATSADVGDIVRVEGPFGSSYLRERHTGPIVCVAGGSGLAPIQSIVETALSRGMRQPIKIYFGARTEKDLYQLDLFAKFELSHANVRFIPVLSAPSGPTVRRIGLVSEAMVQDLADCDGWKAYVAGPPAMVEAVGAVLAERGLRVDDIHADVFFTPDSVPAA